MVATLRTLVAWLSGRRGIVLAGLLGWAVLIGVAAGASPDSARWIGLPPFQWFVVAFLGLTMLVGLGLLVAMVVFRGEGESTPPPKKSWWPAIVLLLLLVALSLRGPRDEEAEEQPEQTITEESDGTDNGRRSDVLTGQELVALLLILSGSIAIVVWTRRRIASLPALPVEHSEPSLEAELAPVVGAAADHLRFGQDPRSSVLLAYDGLEQALAKRGLDREKVETPSEHLHRVLNDLTIDSSPLLELAALYEIARFSNRTITPADQRNAAIALGRARDDLASLRAGRGLGS